MFARIGGILVFLLTEKPTQVDPMAVKTKEFKVEDAVKKNNLDSTRPLLEQTAKGQSGCLVKHSSPTDGLTVSPCRPQERV